MRLNNKKVIKLEGDASERKFYRSKNSLCQVLLRITSNIYILSNAQWHVNKTFSQMGRR